MAVSTAAAANVLPGNPVDKDIERRKWPRLGLRLNVEFFFPEEGQGARGGTTENVSAGGMYFRTSDWAELEVGQNLSLNLSGLSAYNLGPIFRSLRGKVTVLRLEAPEEEDTSYAQAGVAVRFDERPRMDVYLLSA